jgi:hypothetical protein
MLVLVAHCVPNAPHTSCVWSKALRLGRHNRLVVVAIRRRLSVPAA